MASTDIATTSPRAVPRPVAVIGTAGTATSRVCCCRFVLQCATGAERGDTRCLSNAFRRSARKGAGHGHSQLTAKDAPIGYQA